jgi:hypothetical protein
MSPHTSADRLRVVLNGASARRRTGAGTIVCMSGVRAISGLWSDRRDAAAVRRQNKGYSFRVRTVANAEWVSQLDAAKELKIGRGLRVGALVITRQLEPVQNARGQAGVSLESLNRQKARRDGAGLLRRAWLFIRDAALAFPHGI